GFERWRRTPAPQRGDVIRRVGDILTARKDEIARIMTREMGKVLEETRGDVQEGIETAYYAETEGRRLFGYTVPSELPDKWAMTYRRPIGIRGIIPQSNSPLAITTGPIFSAFVYSFAVLITLTYKWSMTYRRLIGICGIITPFNFPLAIPTWKIFPALVCGNAVIFKPAEDVPHTATVFVEILLEAGLPPDVIQLVHGRGEEV